MNTIEQNPYRILGLLVGATAREQTRQIIRLKQYVDAGQEPPEDFSFPVLGKFQRTVESIEVASSKLNLDDDKINAAMFWFYKGNDITDEPAFEALKEGDIATAKSIWEKLIIGTNEDGKRYWKEVTKKNHSAFHNWFILEFIMSKTIGSLSANIKFLDSDFVNDFKNLIADITYQTSKKDLQLSFLQQFLFEIENSHNISLNQIVEILNNNTFAAKKDFLTIII
jgi:hypothetical protein